MGMIPKPNTKTMCVCFLSQLQWGNLDVVVPPDILNEADTNGSSLDESVTNEGGQIQLVCIATGVPGPTVSIPMQFSSLYIRFRFLCSFL